MADIIEVLEKKIKDAQEQMQKQSAAIQATNRALDTLNGAIQAWQEAISEIRKSEKEEVSG